MLFLCKNGNFLVLDSSSFIICWPNFNLDCQVGEVDTALFWTNKNIMLEEERVTKNKNN